MDIRNFFGAKKTGGSKSKSGSSSSKKKGSSKRKSPSKQTATSKKQKQIEDDAQQVQEISPTDFFATANNANNDKKTPEKKVPKAKPKPKNTRKPAEKEESDDEPVQFIKTTTPEKKPKEVVEIDSDEKDEEYEDDEVKDVTPTKKLPSRPAASSPAKRRQAASRNKEASPPTKKTKQSPLAKKEKMAILEPTLEKDSFDVDSSQVSEFMQGLTFVFTGVLKNLAREDAMDLVKMLGARVTTAVSSKTSYLVAGSVLEDGRPYTEGSKFFVAEEKEVNVVLGEKKLYGLCHLYHERAKKEKGITAALPATSKPTSAPSNPYAKKVATNPYASKSTPNPYAKKAPVANPYAKKVANPYAKASGTNPYAKASGTNPYAKKSNEQSSTSEAVSKSSNDPNQLWADRHAPTHTREILGNKEKVTKLQRCKFFWKCLKTRIQLINLKLILLRDFFRVGSMGKTVQQPSCAKENVVKTRRALESSTLVRSSRNRQ